MNATMLAKGDSILPAVVGFSFLAVYVVWFLAARAIKQQKAVQARARKEPVTEPSSEKFPWINEIVRQLGNPDETVSIVTAFMVLMQSPDVNVVTRNNESDLPCQRDRIKVALAIRSTSAGPDSLEEFAMAMVILSNFQSEGLTLQQHLERRATVAKAMSDKDMLTVARITKHRSDEMKLCPSPADALHEFSLLRAAVQVIQEKLQKAKQ